LERFVAETGADELLIASAIFDQAARIRSYELLAPIGASLGATAGARKAA
ncbi:MAG: LLM class flavin-dependent oxidoreductase, partial [Pseudomonadota bacterium]|nr:LLM class flavin-dependent oxidoreductase [Pseudomonadota bacterium]